MGCQQGKAQATQNKDVSGGGGTKSGIGRSTTMKNGNAQKVKDEEDKNGSFVDETKNENGVTNDDNKNINIKSNNQSINEEGD